MKIIVYGLMLAILGNLIITLSQPTGAYALQSAPLKDFTSFGVTTVKVSKAKQLEEKAKTSWPWYVSRSAGIIAAVLLVLLILSGIGQITGLTYRILEPLAAWSLHRALGIALGISIAVHGLSLLFDKYSPFTLLQITVPFTSHYLPVKIWGKDVGSLYIAFGILSFYLIALLLITSLFYRNKKPKLWRITHYSSYLLVVLVFLHAFYLGTDLKSGVLRILYWASAVIILAAVMSRLRRARTLRRQSS